MCGAILASQFFVHTQKGCTHTLALFPSVKRQVFYVGEKRKMKGRTTGLSGHTIESAKQPNSTTRFEIQQHKVLPILDP